MNANELRLGNYVMIHDYAKGNRQQTVEELGVCQVNLLDEQYCTPIPLTEEWLLKFGFVEKYMSCHRRWTKDGISIDQITDEDDEGGKIPQEQIFFYKDREISSVHQLQNLFFALTGEELIYKK